MQLGRGPERHGARGALPQQGGLHHPPDDGRREVCGLAALAAGESAGVWAGGVRRLACTLVHEESMHWSHQAPGFLDSTFTAMGAQHTAAVGGTDWE